MPLPVETACPTTAMPSGGQTDRGVNPYVFFVGSPRSGTTMLKRMAGAHSRLAVTRETHWIPKVFEKRQGVTAEGRVLPGLTEKLFAHHRFPQMKISRDRLTRILQQNPDMHYADLVACLFDHYGQRKHKPLVGDKTPSYVRKLPTLTTLWPQARVVHLIRDGRNVCLSLRNWRMVHKAAGRFGTWQADPIVTAALWWKTLVALGRQDGKVLGAHRYRELHYEKLVEQPREACTELADFLDLPYEDAMAHYYLGKTRSGVDLSANAAWLPPTVGLRDWRKQMPPADLERFEEAAGDLLDALAYPRGCSEISTAVKRQVARVKEQFTQEANARNWRLPESW